MYYKRIYLMNEWIVKRDTTTFVKNKAELTHVVNCLMQFNHTVPALLTLQVVSAGQTIGPAYTR